MANERRRVSWFFAGLLIVNASLNIFGAFLVSHQGRSRLLQSLLPSMIPLGDELASSCPALALLFLARGVTRGKRIAWQFSCIVLIASIAFDLVKDLDFENGALAAWILCGLWWFRRDFIADSDPASLRRGLVILAAGIMLAGAYAVGGALLLGNQLAPGFGIERSLEHLVRSMVASPAAYTALTGRADWFLSSLPIVAYGLVLIAVVQLLRPSLAPHVVAAERERLRELVSRWGRNHISHLAIHATVSFFQPDSESCVAFNLHGRTALALGDPVGDPSALEATSRHSSAIATGRTGSRLFIRSPTTNPTAAPG